MRYVIYGRYRDNPIEEIETCFTERDARYLLAEYRLAFGPDWFLFYRRKA